METSAIVTAITSAAGDLTADAAPIIAAAVSIGVVFFGAKLLWGKFKSMAR